MKKVLLLISIIILTFTLGGCSSEEENKLVVDKAITDLLIIVNEIGETPANSDLDSLLNYKSDIQEIQNKISKIKKFKDKEYSDKLKVVNYTIEKGLYWFNNSESGNFLYTDGLLEASNKGTLIINKEVVIESGGGKYMPVTDLGQVDFNTYEFYGDIDFLKFKDGDTFTINYGYYSDSDFIDILDISK